VKVSSISLGLLGFALSSTVHAAGPEVEIGAEYQVNVINTSDGLNDKDWGPSQDKPQTQTKTTSLNLKGAKILFRGKLSDQISWSVFYKAKEGELERYYLTNKVTDSLDVTIGKQKIKTYGLHRRLAGTLTPVLGAYLDQNPLKDKVAIDVTYKLAGTLSLQLVDDYSKCSDATSITSTLDPATNKVTSTSATTTTCTTWNKGSSSGIVTNSKETQTTQKQPAVTLEWYGSFGEFAPLLQYAVYDSGKSSTISGGVRYKAEGIDVYVDYTQDTRNFKGVDPADATKFVKEKNVYTGIVAYAEYKVGDYSPFLHVSSFDTDPFEKSGILPVDKTAAESNSQGKLDKNEMTFAVGTHFDKWGAFYRPFVDVTMSSGRFVDPTDKSKDKVLNKTDLVAGLSGKF
jgi:hypothetical protein